MTMRTITVQWLLGLGFAIALGCSSQGTSGRDKGAGGAGGGASDAGSGDDGGAASDARFACGDASCSVAREYCRDLSGGIAGASGANDGGGFDPVHIISCVPFDPCAARDCSCVPKGGADYCYTCIRQDGGGTAAMCGPI
jgi:hypothetical protein